LEDRQLLATALLTAPDVLTITGTNQSDRISVRDNGTNNAGAIVVQDQNGIIFTSATAITTIVITSNNPNSPGTDKGTDDVSYTLSGRLTVPRAVLPTFADSKNNFTANINGNINDGFILVVTGLIGKKDNFQVNVNATTQTAGMFLFLQGGTGPNTLAVNVTNGLEITADNQLTVIEKGGGGDSKVDYNFNGKLDGTGVTEARMSVDVEGGSGKDKVSATINLNSPGGRLFGPVSPFAPNAAPINGRAAVVKGNAGDDRLSFVVNGQPDPATSFALIDGTPAAKTKCHEAGAVNLEVGCAGSF
jgi:hypothetical protein